MAEAPPNFISLISPPHKTHDPNMNFDILLKNGKISDGTGTPWIIEDVGLRVYNFAIQPENKQIRAGAYVCK